MKRILVVAVMLMIFVVSEHRALAIVSTGATTAPELRDAVVSGNFGGYKSGLVYLVRPDGVRIAYPFEPNKELIKRIGKFRLNLPLRLVIHDGQVVRFEEVRR